MGALKGSGGEGLGDDLFRRVFLDHTAVMILIDPPTFRVIDVNHAAVRFYGYGREVFRSLNFAQVSVLPEETVRAAMAEAIASGEGVFQADHRLADGAVRRVEMRTAPIAADGAPLWFAIVHDITDRHQAEEELRRERARMEALLTKSPVAMTISRPRDGMVLYANEAAGRMIGVPTTELIGRPVKDFYADPAVRDRLLEQFRRDGHVRGAEVELKASDGGTAWGSATFEMFPSDDELLVVAWQYDITAQKRAHEILRAGKEVAERADRAKSTFLAMMSHEIRTPLTDVLGMSDLMLSDGLPDRHREYAETIRSSARALLTIVDDILDLTKLEVGRMEIERLSVDLVGLTGGALSLMRPRARAKGLSLDVRIDETLPRTVMGDPTRLRQVLLNLVGNAVKFTEKGGVAIVVGAQFGEDGSDRLRVEVADTGIGMTAEVADTLFNDFTQGDGSISRRFGGSGLGLAICRRLVTLMRGRIGVDSMPGKGSRFWFDLPLETASAPAVEEAPAVEVVPNRPLTVLIADDNPVNRKVVDALLTRAGHRVEQAADGLEALRAVETSGGRFDAVLMDMQMPGMDGLESTRRIRALAPPLGSIPIAAMTANAFKEDEARCLAAGMTAYLTKPVSADRILATLARVTGTDGPASPPAGTGNGPN